MTRIALLVVIALAACEYDLVLPHSREETATGANPVSSNTINKIQDQLVHGTRTEIFLPARDGFPSDWAGTITTLSAAPNGAVWAVDLDWRLPLAGKSMAIDVGKRILEIRCFGENADVTPAKNELYVRLWQSLLDDPVNYDGLDTVAYPPNGFIEDADTTGTPAAGLHTITLATTNLIIPADRMIGVSLLALPPWTGSVIRWRRVEVDYDYPAP